MARWFIRFTLAIFLLFFGVLFGMQEAHRGMERMRGYADPSFPSVIDMKKGKMVRWKRRCLAGRSLLEI